ncbi:MAG: tRNA lysidine(34) synthetase TilS [Planctomycetota bacterium]|nr:tRNA lysidine(34) synthetase TilS [Planctomycetota bacterium]
MDLILPDAKCKLPSKIRPELDTLIPGKDHFLIALSGGADSVALTRAVSLVSTNTNYSVVHVHHSLRGEEADSDQQFCVQLAERFGIECITKKINPAVYDRPGSIEEIAREERYRLLGQAAEETGASKILLAHHADDNAETILYRIMKGTGLRGLRGIPIRRQLEPGSEVEIIRPMLKCTREEIVAWLREIGQDYCEDSSNQDEKHLRNYLRRTLLPAMEEVSQGAREKLLVLARHAADAFDLVERQAMGQLPHLVLKPSTSACLELNAELLMTLHPAERAGILDVLAREHLDLFYGLLSTHHDQALQILAKGTGQVQLPGQAFFAMESGRFCFYKSYGPAEGLSPLSLEVPGETMLPDGTKIITETVLAPPGIDEIRKLSARVAYVDMDAIQPPLRTRSRQPGDRFRPMGMQRSRKLKEVFIKCKLPRSQRDRMPLIEDKENIIWIPGIRLAEGYQILSSSARVLRIEIKPAGDAVWAQTTTRGGSK